MDSFDDITILHKTRPPAWYTKPWPLGVMALLFAGLLLKLWGGPSERKPLIESRPGIAFEKPPEEAAASGAGFLKAKFQAVLDSAKGSVQKMTSSTCENICARRFQKCTEGEMHTRRECETHRTSCFGECQNPKPGVDYHVEE